MLNTLKKVYSDSLIQQISLGNKFLSRDFCDKFKEYGITEDEMKNILYSAFQCFMSKQVDICVKELPKYIQDPLTKISNDFNDIKGICDLYKISERRFMYMFKRRFFLSFRCINICTLIIDNYGEKEAINLLWSLTLDNYIRMEVKKNDLNPHRYPQIVLDAIPVGRLSTQYMSPQKLIYSIRHDQELFPVTKKCYERHLKSYYKHSMNLTANYVPNIKKKVVKLLCTKYKTLNNALCEMELSERAFDGIFSSNMHKYETLHKLARYTGIPFQDIKISILLDMFECYFVLRTLLSNAE